MRYTFGPVPSRRLGYSLGIDIVPLKTCTYDCIYCQLGRTAHKALDREAYVEVGPVVEEVQEILASERQIDYLTFSGSGEPTLNVNIGAMIRAIKAITSIPVAVLTNGSLFHRKRVREDLLAADLIIPSLDAASETVFERMNRPQFGLKLGNILRGLKQLREEFTGQIWLEIMLVQGVNDGDDEIARMHQVIEEVRPDRIQLNTVVRPPTEAYAHPLSAERMETIRARFGDQAEIIAPFHKEQLFIEQKDIKERILGMIQRRPVTLEDICGALQVHRNEALKYIVALEQEGQIKETRFADVPYYEAAED